MLGRKIVLHQSFLPIYETDSGWISLTFPYQLSHHPEEGCITLGSEGADSMTTS